MARKLAVIFIVAFSLNAVWENFHSALYANYKGNPITELVLMRAALFDAFVIALASFFFLRFNIFKNKIWLMAAALVAFAVLLELWALNTGRWQYKDIMPIIPLVGTGLTPTIQLGILGYISYKIAIFRRLDSRKRIK